MIQKLAKPGTPSVISVTSEGELLQLNVGVLVDKLNEIIDVVNYLDEILSSDAHGWLK